MIKKLYTTEVHEQIDEDQQFVSINQQQSNDDLNKNLTTNLRSRQIFSYDFKQYWLVKTFDSKWCCCCRKRQDSKNILFIKADKKLEKEFDVLRIINLLRVQEYMS